MLALEAKYSSKVEINPDLSRKLVSFQDSKKLPVSRWFKFKEGYSAQLVEYCLEKTGVTTGSVFDPFAGSGTTLFTANRLSLDSFGVELLPVAQEIIEVQNEVLQNDPEKLAAQVAEFLENKPWTKIVAAPNTRLNSIAITDGAYPTDTERSILAYNIAISHLEPTVSRILRFAVLCILESVSYTRKDGQFLRWDARSGRSRSSKVSGFDKGKIYSFEEAISIKLHEIAEDLASASTWDKANKIQLMKGSVLRLGSQIASESQDALVTSPPYLNRYDYTRTYALELAYLGITEEEIKSLRQELLSATVENRLKDLTQSDAAFHAAAEALAKVPAFVAASDYLKTLAQSGRLNNKGISRMFDYYFTELSAVIWHSARALRSKAPFIMVNDNVRYGGLVIPVDLILSEVANQFGLGVEKIWALPVNKGNSSQQMGSHGRLPTRKCVYVWRKR
mgnify:CR=1 FL=1